MDKKLKKFAAVCLATGLLAFSGATLTGCKPPVGDPTIVDPGNNGGTTGGNNGGGTTQPPVTTFESDFIYKYQEGVSALDYGDTLMYGQSVLEYYKDENPTTMNQEKLNDVLWRISLRAASVASYSTISQARQGIDTEFSNIPTESMTGYSPDYSSKPQIFIDAELDQLGNDYLSILHQIMDTNSKAFKNLTKNLDKDDYISGEEKYYNNLKAELGAEKFNTILHTLRAQKYQDMRQVNKEGSRTASDLTALYKKAEAFGVNETNIQQEFDKMIYAFSELNYLSNGISSNPQELADLFAYIFNIEQLYAITDDVLYRIENESGHDIKYLSTDKSPLSPEDRSLYPERSIDYINSHLSKDQQITIINEIENTL